MGFIYEWLRNVVKISPMGLAFFLLERVGSILIIAEQLLFFYPFPCK